MLISHFIIQNIPKSFVARSVNYIVFIMKLSAEFCYSNILGANILLSTLVNTLLNTDTEEGRVEIINAGRGGTYSAALT
jgi:hypothetical protein